MQKRVVTVTRPISFVLVIGVVGVYTVVVPDLLMLVGLALRMVFPHPSEELPIYWLWIIWINGSLVNAFVLAIGIRVIEKTRQVLEIVWKSAVPPYKIYNTASSLELIPLEQMSRSRLRSKNFVKVLTSTGVIFSVLLSTIFYRFVFRQELSFMKYLDNIPIELLLNIATILIQAPVKEVGQSFAPSGRPGVQFIYLFFSLITLLPFTIAILNFNNYIYNMIRVKIFYSFKFLFGGKQRDNVSMWLLWIVLFHNLLFYFFLYTGWAAI